MVDDLERVGMTCEPSSEAGVLGEVAVGIGFALGFLKDSPEEIAVPGGTLDCAAALSATTLSNCAIV